MIKPIQVFGIGVVILVAGLISESFLLVTPLVVLVGLNLRGHPIGHDFRCFLALRKIEASPRN